MRTQGNLAAALLTVALSAVAVDAHAEQAFNKKAAAEALFQEGSKMYAEGEYAQACSKFEASHTLDEALGTLLRLADCYDRQGKTASAWAAFQAAAETAQAQEQPEREDIARERAEELRARLSYMVLVVNRATRDLEGVKLAVNGTEVPSGTWGSPIPVNPGSQVVRVEAPGYQAWSDELAIEEAAGTHSVTVPALLPAELEQRVGPGVRESSAAPDQGPEREPRRAPGATQRTWGYISGGVGLVTLGVGGYFSYRAYDLNEQSMDHCLAGATTACTDEGKSLRDDARSNGTLATVVSAAGLTLVGVSAVLLLTAPDDESATQGPGLNLAARATPGTAHIELEGRW
jgi:hypothetical protein